MLIYLKKKLPKLKEKGLEKNNHYLPEIVLCSKEEADFPQAMMERISERTPGSRDHMSSQFQRQYFCSSVP